MTLRIGRFTIKSLEFGHFRLDGGAMFGVVPKVLWEKQYPADAKNRIDMALRCMLIEVDDRKILVDTGFGEGRSEKFRQIYGYSGSDDYLNEALANAGASPDQITDVVLTHLHFDHCGGSTLTKNSDPTPSFPNATYYIQKDQLTQARAKLDRDKASYLSEDFEPLIIKGFAEIKNGEWRLIPGIDFMICNGHTPGQQLPIIRDKDQILFYAGDLIPLAAQFSPPWIMAYDLYPVTTLKEKQRVLPRAAKEGWMVFFEHDPYQTIARVVQTDRGFIPEKIY